VYDLVSHKPVPVTPTSTGLELQTTFGPGGGRLFMITSRPVTAIRIDAPVQARLGSPVRVNVAVTDDAGKPIDAVVPVHVEILDPKGRPAEPTGYYGAKDGTLSISLDLAANDLPGAWTIRATELAGGQALEHKFSANP